MSFAVSYQSFAEGGADLYGIDLTDRAVEHTSRRLALFGLESRLAVGDAEHLPFGDDTFDIVYSWGVLHHTGAMHQAIEDAASLVRPGGLFAFAFYRKTRLCGVWTHIKRWYARASPEGQQRARSIYIVLFKLALRATGRDFESYVRNYRSNRGMNFEHDLHDWIGGYPYESIRPSEVAAAMAKSGFEHVRSNTRPYEIGFFGSGCDEYVYRRR